MEAEIKPAMAEGDDRGGASFPFNVEALHRDRLPDKFTTLEDLLPKLREALEGPWAYSSFGMQKFSFVNPVFTRGGDFVLELYPYDQGAVNMLVRGICDADGSLAFNCRPVPGSRRLQ